MKRALIGFSLVALLLGGFALWLESALKQARTHVDVAPQGVEARELGAVSQEKRLKPVPCGNVDYLRHQLETVAGDTLNVMFLLAEADAAGRLLAAYPCVREVSRGGGLLTCAVPKTVAREWMEHGLRLGGIEGFDAEMPLALYGSVATSDRFLGTASLQAASLLTGAGEVVSVIDSGISTGNAATFHEELLPALYGMTVEPSVWNAASSTPKDISSNSHGTHVAGCVVAQQKRYTDVRGSAPGAALYFHAFGSGYLDNALGLHFQRCWDVGARIVNCSWGHSTYPTRASYNTYSKQIDQFVWDHPEMLLCFAVGNDGEDLNRDNVVDLNSIYSGETHAKNVLTVGAQESYRPTYQNKNSEFEGYTFGATLANDFIAKPYDGEHDGMLALSSRGPLKDGRIAPMLVAPGSLIVSTLKGGGVGMLTGTSMATPIVSGAAAVMRQYLREGHQIESPTAALVRAGLILASETLAPGQFGTGDIQEIPFTSPNNVEGWGALRLGKMFQEGKMLGFQDRITLTAAKAETTFTIEGVEANTPLSVVLSWIDAPAAVGLSANVLINDYDLILRSPSGVETCLDDHQHPIERLILNVEESGTWTIIVRAARISATGTGNLAAVAWRATCSQESIPLPKAPQTDETVTLTVRFPEGSRPYLDYPVWPAPGSHRIKKGAKVNMFYGAKLAQTMEGDATPLAGWILKASNGARKRGTDHFTQVLEDVAEVRWYQSFPGASLRLR